MQIEAVAIPHFLIYASYKNEKFNVAAMKKMGLGSVVGMNLREGVSDLKEKIIEGFSRADERRLAKRNK